MEKTRKKTRFRFSRRRWRNSIATLVLIAILAAIVYAQNQSLNHASFLTGYLLIGSIVFLAAFNIRKKLPFIPGIGTAAAWMQLHIYVGLSTFAIFGFHIAWKVPKGGFETVLALLYLTVAISGVYGLVISRTYPTRLRRIGNEVLFERIPFLRQQLAVQARELVLRACQSSDVLAKLYANRLAYFFERQRSLAYLVRPTGNQRRQLISAIEDLDRYLGEDQRSIGRQLSALVQQRDDLDFQYALQGRLKAWLFVHIGFTYSLLIVSIIHMVMAHAFAGGLA